MVSQAGHVQTPKEAVFVVVMVPKVSSLSVPRVSPPPTGGRVRASTSAMVSMSSHHPRRASHKTAADRTSFSIIRVSSPQRGLPALCCAHRAPHAVRSLGRRSVRAASVAHPLRSPLLFLRLGGGTRWLRHGAEAGHRRPPVETLLSLGCFGRGDGRLGLDGRRGRVLGRVCLGPARVGGRASCVGRVVDVLAVDVDGVGDESGAAVAAAGVALLEPEELDPGLDAVEETETHCNGR
jgi:hypothetical protein